MTRFVVPLVSIAPRWPSVRHRALAVTAALLLAGCSNLLKADFQSFAAGAPPPGAPQPSSGIAVALPASPSEDMLDLYAHGGGSYTIVAAPPPTANKGLALGGTGSAPVCQASTAAFTTIPLTKGNYKRDKPTYFSWTVTGGGPGNLRVEVSGKLQSAPGGDSPWRVLLVFAVRDGQIAEILSSTMRVPIGFTTVTSPQGGTYTVLLTIDEANNRWTASFLLPAGMNPPGFTGLPRLQGSLRPELNFPAVPPAALTLSFGLTDRDCRVGATLRHVIDNVTIGQQQ